MQDHYNLIYREEENEMLPLCQRNGVAVIPWSPLARGRLTRSGETTARLVSDEFGKSLYSASEETMRRSPGISRTWRKNSTPAAPSRPRRLLSKPGVAAPIIGPSRQEQLDDLLQAVDLTLSRNRSTSWRRRISRIRWWDLSEGRGFPGSVALPGRGG